MPTELHFAENPFALHLFLERPQGLIDVIVANMYANQSRILLPNSLTR